MSIICVLVALAYWWVKETYSFFEKRNIPHDKPTPLLGTHKDVLLQRENFFDNIESVYRKLKKYSYIFVATKVIVCKISILYTQICNT